jgi:hypothetical protein
LKFIVHLTIFVGIYCVGVCIQSRFHPKVIILTQSYFSLIAAILLVLVFESRSNSRVVIVTNNPEVEVFVNDSSLGKGDTVIVNLPNGRYHFKGKMDGCFDDIEWRILRRNSSREISLTLRPFEIYLAPRMQVIFYGPDLLGASFFPTIGLKFLRNHYAGIDIMKFVNMETDTMLGVGLEYRFLFETQLFKLHVGSTVGFYNFKIETSINSANGFDATSTRTTRSLYTKPLCDLHFGYERIATFIGFGCILSEKVMPVLECGMSFSL